MTEFPLYALLAIGTFLARLLVGSVLLVAGLAKLQMPSNQFLQAIMGYELIPKQFARVLSISLPWVEMLVGGLLIIGLWSRVVTVLASVLFLAFSSAILTSLLRGRDNDCGCFKSVTPVQMRLVYRNWVLLGLLLPIHIFKGGLWAIDTRNLQAISDFQPTLGLSIIVLFWTVLPMFSKRFVRGMSNSVIRE